jgi:hypothetical protein
VRVTISSVKYPLRYLWNEDNYTLPHQPRNRLTQGTRSINPAIYKYWLMKSILPGEQVYVQDREDAEISDRIATSMAILNSYTTEAIRRSKLNQHRLRVFSVDNVKMKAEVLELKGRADRLASDLKQTSANKAVAEARIALSDEALGKEIQLRESLEAKLAKEESLLETQRQHTRQLAEDKENRSKTSI